jgi:protein-disulfide isomerase
VGGPAKGGFVNRKWLVVATAVAVVAAFAAGAWFYEHRAGQQVVQALDGQPEALVRPHAPVYGNPDAKVTIAEFIDPSCETCRAYHPIVKRIVNSSFGQVRLVLRYAPLHQGSDTAVRILEAARQQGRYWEVLDAAFATQPRWAAHDRPQPELLWDLLAEQGLDMAQARAAAASPAVDALLRQDVADLLSLKVNRTPTFFVNGVPLRDFGEAPLKALVEQELPKARPP